MLVIIQVVCIVLSVSYVLHQTVLLLDLCPTDFICDICDEAQQTGGKAYCFFLSFIPLWPRTHIKVSEVQALVFLFPNTVFLFFRVQLNCSLQALEFRLSQQSVVKSAQSLLNLENSKGVGESQFSYRLLFSLTSLLLAENRDGPCSQPYKV